MKEIISLLRKWESYKNEGYPDDLTIFGNWLSSKGASEGENLGEDLKNKGSFTGYMMGLLIGYTEHWTKIAFRDLPIKGLTDFGIIMYILDKGNPSKTEIASESLSEKSTVFESLKRLERNQLLEEILDSTDKRVRRVKLTEYGYTIAIRAAEKAKNLSVLLEGNLSQEDKQKFMKILERLSNFHDDLYRNHTSDEVTKAFDI